MPCVRELSNEPGSYATGLETVAPCNCSNCTTGRNGVSSAISLFNSTLSGGHSESGAGIQTNFVVSENGFVTPLPYGVQGPFKTLYSGQQYLYGTGGGPGMAQEVTGVRIMDADGDRARTVYMDSNEDKVNPFANSPQPPNGAAGGPGSFIPNSHPAAHLYHDQPLLDSTGESLKDSVGRRLDRNRHVERHLNWIRKWIE